MHQYVCIEFESVRLNLLNYMFSISHADNTSDSVFSIFLRQTPCFPYFLRQTLCFPYFFTSDSVFSIFYTPCFPFFDFTLRDSGSGTPAPCFPFNPPASRSCDFVITRLISDQIALHSVQLPLLIALLIFSIVIIKQQRYLGFYSLCFS